MTTMTHDISIARQPADVLAFAADPTQWRRWHPTTVSVDGSAVPRVGDAFHEIIRAGPIRGAIAWRVTGWTPTTYEAHGEVDFLLMAGTIVDVLYEVSPEPGGTRFRRRLTYASDRRMSRLADRLVFRNHNARQSVTALASLKSCLERAG